MRGKKVLIAGGYGTVGRMVAAQLARELPDRIIVAGRRSEHAESAAAAIGHGVEARTIDLYAADATCALDDVGLVVVCLDQASPRFAHECLARGIHYVDISAHSEFLVQVEALSELARANGCTALLSVGVQPGLTNLLAAHAQGRMPQVDRLDIHLELGLGDRHGRAAVEWMLDNLDSSYEVWEEGQRRRVRSMRERQALRLPGKRKRRSGYRFNFSDQHVLPRTLAVPSVSSWVRFSSGAFTWLLAKGVRCGLGRVLRISWLRRMTVWLMTHVHIGSDACVVAVRATGATPAGGQELILGVAGSNEAAMTATVTAESVRQLLAGESPAGVFHLEQVIPLAPVISALTAEIPGIQWQVDGDCLSQTKRGGIRLPV